MKIIKTGWRKSLNTPDSLLKLYFSTDLKQAGDKIVRYYQAHFQNL